MEQPPHLVIPQMPLLRLMLGWLWWLAAFTHNTVFPKGFKAFVANIVLLQGQTYCTGARGRAVTMRAQDR